MIPANQCDVPRAFGPGLLAVPRLSDLCAFFIVRCASDRHALHLFTSIDERRYALEAKRFDLCGSRFFVRFERELHVTLAHAHPTAVLTLADPLAEYSVKLRVALAGIADAQLKHLTFRHCLLLWILLDGPNVRRRNRSPDVTFHVAPYTQEIRTWAPGLANTAALRALTLHDRTPGHERTVFMYSFSPSTS